MKCPHCHEGVHESWSSQLLGEDFDYPRVDVETMKCPQCERLIVRLVLWEMNTFHSLVATARPLAYPQGVARPVPPEVTGEYAQDFREASIVLAFSPKASAALSRRLLQHIIREKAGITGRDLNAEIDELIESNTLQSDLAEDLDALRTVGNFAAHPTKSTNTGEVVGVEPGEAEWLLALLDELLDFFFVRPAIRERKRLALNEKLADSGKPRLKGTEAT